ncbi:uncharacterized [Tachysurus ichikawai]
MFAAFIVTRYTMATIKNSTMFVVVVATFELSVARSKERRKERRKRRGRRRRKRCSSAAEKAVTQYESTFLSSSYIFITPSTITTFIITLTTRPSARLRFSLSELHPAIYTPSNTVSLKPVELQYRGLMLITDDVSFKLRSEFRLIFTQR